MSAPAGNGTAFVQRFVIHGMRCRFTIRKRPRTDDLLEKNSVLQNC
jgi:hypothetical protein